MNSSVAEIDSNTLTTEQQLAHLRKQLEVLYENLRTVRHGINNDVAVIMAMAELSQRNPAQAAKLAQICLEKSPQISSAISGFTELYSGLMNIQKDSITFSRSL